VKRTDGKKSLETVPLKGYALRSSTIQHFVRESGSSSNSIEIRTESTPSKFGYLYVVSMRGVGVCRYEFLVGFIWIYLIPASRGIYSIPSAREEKSERYKKRMRTESARNVIVPC
jgi:hypothetical protein